MGSNLPNFDRAEYVQPSDNAVTLDATRESVDHAVFTKAIFYGCAAAAAGSILYGIIGIFIHIGYAGLLVGFMVGKAMMFASDNLGGRKYQWTSATLTYFAIAMAAAVEVIIQAVRQGHGPTHVTAGLVEFVALYGIASPFLRFEGNFVSALINFVILIISIRQAWRMTAGTRTYQV